MIETANVDVLRDFIEHHRAKAERVLDHEVRVLNCYEAGYEGFWLARWLDGAMALETVVLDPASLLVNRKAKQRKTDRGNAAVLSRARVPSVEEEDRKRLHRERQRLVKERTSLTNSIRGLLKLHSIFDLQPRSKDFEAKFADVKTAYGEPLPPRARQEILRIAERLALVEEQIARVEAERDAFVLSGEAISMVDAPEGSQARAAAKIAALTRLKAIGPNDVTILTHEVFYRGFRNRRELASDANPLGERRHATRPGDQPRRSRMDPGTAHPNGVALAALSA